MHACVCMCTSFSYHIWQFSFFFLRDADVSISLVCTLISPFLDAQSKNKICVFAWIFCFFFCSSWTFWMCLAQCIPHIWLLWYNMGTCNMRIQAHILSHNCHCLCVCVCMCVNNSTEIVLDEMIIAYNSFVKLRLLVFDLN